MVMSRNALLGLQETKTLALILGALGFWCMAGSIQSAKFLSAFWIFRNENSICMVLNNKNVHVLRSGEGETSQVIIGTC